MNLQLLTQAQQEYYSQNGYLILPNFVSHAICELLMTSANQLMDNFETNSQQSIFSTKQSNINPDQDYFLTSSDKIHFFFEENAFDDAGKLKQDKKYSINKIGHALHELHPVFKLFSHTHKIAQLVQELSIQDPCIVQSMYICKPPLIGGEVNCHQDSTFLFVEGKPITGLWFALQDATIENACLWAIPGAHRDSLKSRMYREQNQLNIETLDDTPWAMEKMIPLEVQQGSLIVLHGLLPHMSKENHSKHSRHAYSIHLMSSQDQWSKQNWLQRPTPFPSLLS